MMEFDFGVAIAVTSGVGLLSYFVACAYHRVWPPVAQTLEALGFGALVAVGLRMIYGAFNAGELCSIVDDHGKLVEDAHLHLKFGEHTWEIFAGGVCIVLASLYSLGWVCRKPSHGPKH